MFSSRRNAPGIAAFRKTSTSTPFGTSATRPGGTLHVRTTNCRPRSELTSTPAARRISSGKSRATYEPRRQMAVPNTADDPRSSWLREDAVSAREPVDGVNHVDFVLLEKAVELETTADIESAGTMDEGQWVTEFAHSLTIGTHARGEANDSDGSPCRAAKLSEQLERLPLSAAEAQMRHDHNHSHRMSALSHGLVIRLRTAPLRPPGESNAARPLIDTDIRYCCTMLGIVYLRLTSAAPCVPYRRRVSALEAIRCIARNSDSGFAPQISPAGASAGGVSSERFDPTSVAMQGRPDAIASRSALDMPSEREGSTKTSKSARKFFESAERPRNRIRVSAAARCRSASAHDLSTRPAISSSTRCLASNRKNASTSRSVPFIGLTVPSVPNLTISSRSRPPLEEVRIQRNAVWDDFEQPRCR